jgi:hypothetical protein
MCSGRNPVIQAANAGDGFREIDVVSATVGFKLLVGGARKGSSPKLAIRPSERALAAADKQPDSGLEKAIFRERAGIRTT